MGQAQQATLVQRLHQIAHPLHAAALTIHALTGTSTVQLALIRGSDVNETATVIKVHNSTAHRRCRVHPVPGWARPLLSAAKTYGRFQQRDSGQALFPLIGSRDCEELRRTAAGIRYRLPATP